MRCRERTKQIQEDTRGREGEREGETDRVLSVKAGGGVCNRSITIAIHSYSRFTDSEEGAGHCLGRGPIGFALPWTEGMGIKAPSIAAIAANWTAIEMDLGR